VKHTLFVFALLAGAPALAESDLTDASVGETNLDALSAHIEQALSIDMPGRYLQRGGGGGRVKAGAISGAAGVAPMGMQFGLGLQGGSPSAITFKYMLASDQGVVGGLGAGFDSLFLTLGSLHLDYLWHPYIFLRTPPFKLSFYVGGGLWFLFSDRVFRFVGNTAGFVNSSVAVGLRVPFGLSLALNRLPIEVYLEATPSIFMFPVAFGFLPAGTLGARIYF
jgi:hypothetical protein